MQSKEARKKFKLADGLFREKKYSAALDLLDELDATFPNAKNVMYPKAMCLAKLGRPHEAHELCQKLKAIYNDPRADKLMEKLAAGAQPPPLPTAPGADMAFEPVDLNLDDISAPGGADPLGLDDLFAPKPAAPAAPPAPEPPSRKPLYIGLGIAGGVLLILLVSLPLIMGGGEQAEREAGGTPAAGQTAEAPAEIYWFDSYDNAMNASSEKSAPRLIFFYSADADSTRMMTETWKDQAVVHLMKGWTCIRVDVEADPETASNYEFESPPFTVVENDWGEPVFTRAGFLSALEFYEAVEPLDLQVFDLPEITLARVLLIIVVWIVQAAGSLYLTLLIVRKLPHDEFLKDIISVGLIGVAVSALWGACPCVGIIISIFILRSTYEMEFIDYIAFIAISAITGLFASVIWAAILGLPYSELLEFAGSY